MFQDKAMLVLLALLVTGVVVATLVLINTQRLLSDAPAFAFRPNVEEVERVVCPGDTVTFRFDIVAFEAPLQILATVTWFDKDTDIVVDFGARRFFDVPAAGTRGFQVTTTVPNLPAGTYERVTTGSVGFARIDTHTLIVEVGEC